MHQLVRFTTTLLINSTRVYKFNLTGKQTEIIRSKIQNFSLEMVVQQRVHVISAIVVAVDYLQLVVSVNITNFWSLDNCTPFGNAKPSNTI